jgi:hypothetical protein
MKKITALLVAVVLMLNMMAIMASAEATPTVVDITNDIKWMTSYDMYLNKTAIVRADAILIETGTYDSTLIAKAPGGQMRMVTFTDWAEKGMQNYFNDYFNLGDGFFAYDAVWAESGSDPYDHGRLSYKFTVEEAGMYEIVILGCAQIKEENVDNDAKDRGFAVQVDGGEIQQVNISDTMGTFREYTYSYSQADIEAGTIYTTNGVNNKYFIPTYYYGIQVNLTAGEHTLDYYHLYSSGEHVFESGNSPRLNFMGAYVQKFLTDLERDNYVYPETEPVTEPVTEPQTEPETEPQTEPETDPQTDAPEAPEQTQAPSVTPEQTNAPTTTPDKKGCGGMVGFAAILALIPAAIVIKKKRD